MTNQSHSTYNYDLAQLMLITVLYMECGGEYHEVIIKIPIPSTPTLSYITMWFITFKHLQFNLQVRTYYTITDPFHLTTPPMALLDVHMLDRFIPELERYLLVEDIGIYLISEGLLSLEEYQTIVNYASRREAVVELLHRIKRKGPNVFHIFLQALQRSIKESSPPHQGHVELWDLLQSRVGMQSGEQLLKRKSKSVSSLLGHFAKRRSKTDKVSVDLWKMG